MKKINSYIVITGASSGIGEATALRLARAKKSLILCARRKQRLEALKKECLHLGAVDVICLTLDVTQPATLETFLKKNPKLKVQSLINSAGLARGSELVQFADLTDWEAMIDTNIKGLLYTTRTLLEHIIRERGHIVNLGSVAGRLIYEGGAVYCATKFAVRAFNDGLRMDLKGTGVRVTNIEPGMVNTEFSLVRLGSKQKAESVYQDMMPLSATDIAESIFWCLNQPAHVNIQELVIYPTDQASVGQVVRGEKSIKKLIRS